LGTHPAGPLGLVFELRQEECYSEKGDSTITIYAIEIQSNCGT
jgi:hypothetical protein